MLIDYHSHLLPGMDDGAKNVDTAVKMLNMYKGQGVGRVVATPHFYCHREPIEIFLSRREKALDVLLQVSGGLCILTGAEVYIEKGISEAKSMRELALHNGNHILLELSYGSFKEWMLTEIYQTAYNWGLIPIIAHIERYLQWYSKSDMAQILSIRDAIIQINNDALFKRATLRFALELIRGGFPVIFGSDTHNTSDRPPNVEAAYKILRSKLKKHELLVLMELNEGLL